MTSAVTILILGFGFILSGSSVDTSTAFDLTGSVIIVALCNLYFVAALVAVQHVLYSNTYMFYRSTLILSNLLFSMFMQIGEN